MNQPVKTTSNSYARPYRPRLIAALNAVGRGLGLRGADLSRESLMRAAVKQTGLSDFGDPAALDRLGRLLDALEGEARLHYFGRIMVRQSLLRMLVNRLKVEEAFKRHPEILDIPMEDPIFIVGLQRTGTTMLHRVLAADEANFRFLASWEAINPAPYGPSRGGEDPRVKTAVMAQKALKYLGPDFFAIHPVDARGPEEDCMLFDIDFWSTVPEATQRVPSFSKWLEEQDHIPSYEYYKKVLRYLHWQNPHGRWVLKTPQHMEHLDALFTIFPKARVIQTHRDLRRVVASYCSMMCHAYGLFSDQVDPREISAHWFRKERLMVEHSMAIRGRVGADRFIDVQYADMMADPATQVRRIYAFLGLPFTAESERRVAQWRGENPQHKHGAHRYRLEDFGLTEALVDETFAAYGAQFGIPREASHGN